MWGVNTAIIALRVAPFCYSSVTVSLQHRIQYVWVAQQLSYSALGKTVLLQPRYQSSCYTAHIISANPRSVLVMDHGLDPEYLLSLQSALATSI